MYMYVHVQSIRHNVRSQVLFANTLFKAVCYRPDESQVITGGTDRKVAYWETYDGSQIRELEGSDSGAINGMDVFDKYFVTGSSDKLIKLWQYDEGQVTHIGKLYVHVCVVLHNTQCTCTIYLQYIHCNYIPVCTCTKYINHVTIMINGYNGCIECELHVTVYLHNAAVLIRISPLSFIAYNCLPITNLCFFFLLTQGTGHSGEITRVKIAPNGKHMVSVSADGAIIRWKLPENITRVTIMGQDTTDQEINRSLVEQTEHMSIQGDNHSEQVATSQRVESPQVAVD